MHTYAKRHLLVVHILLPNLLLSFPRELNRRSNKESGTNGEKFTQPLLKLIFSCFCLKSCFNANVKARSSEVMLWSYSPVSTSICESEQCSSSEKSLGANLESAKKGSYMYDELSIKMINPLCCFLTLIEINT